MKWTGTSYPPEDHDVLFKDEGWYVLKLTRLCNDQGFGYDALDMESSIGHDCASFNEMDHIQLLAGDDCVAGICWWCKENIPQSVQTVWTIHNFDFIKTIDPERVGYCKEDAKQVRSIQRAHGI